MRYILLRYMNVEKHCFMARATKQQITTIKYHNENGMNRIRHHISSLVNVFETLVVFGAPSTWEEEVLYLTYIILNENISTGSVSHIVSRKDLDISFTVVSPCLITTSLYLISIWPNQSNIWGPSNRGLSGFISDVIGNK